MVGDTSFTNHNQTNGVVMIRDSARDGRDLEIESYVVVDLQLRTKPFEMNQHMRSISG